MWPSLITFNTACLRSSIRMTYCENLGSETHLTSLTARPGLMMWPFGSSGAGRVGAPRYQPTTISSHPNIAHESDVPLRCLMQILSNKLYKRHVSILMKSACSHHDKSKCSHFWPFSCMCCFVMSVELPHLTTKRRSRLGCVIIAGLVMESGEANTGAISSANWLFYSVNSF